MTNCRNESYGKLITKIGDQSTWANNLLEAHEGVSMIAARALQLSQFAGSLRKGNFVAAANHLSMPGPPKHSTKLKRLKSFGDQWLEYHFGWDPLVKDIGSAMHVLNKTDFGRTRVKSSCSQPININDVQVMPHSFYSATLTGKVSFKQGVSYRVNNGNAFLANQLGFVNPLSVAWEAVPYSFVVDWFANVGQVLSSMTDFVGMSILDSFYTFSTEYGQSVSYGGDHDESFWNGTSFSVERHPGTAKPVLAVKPFKGTSIVRAATAISLLLQKL